MPSRDKKKVIFLGLCLDEKLLFEDHLEYMISKLSCRINIIKIVSHESWKLKKSTIVNLYKSIIRSIFDYACIIGPLLCKTRMKRLQIIQNNVLRIIFKSRRDCPTEELHQLGNIERIDSRLKCLTKLYLVKAVHNNNPLTIN